jgi:hypothetical protein
MNNITSKDKVKNFVYRNRTAITTASLAAVAGVLFVKTAKKYAYYSMLDYYSVYVPKTDAAEFTPKFIELLKEFDISFTDLRNT